MASKKVEICLKKKKPTPSTNIPLLSHRKSEQKQPEFRRKRPTFDLKKTFDTLYFNLLLPKLENYWIK